MTDIHVTKNEELMVAQFEGLTDAGEEFVDRIVTDELVVVDAGRVIVRVAKIPELVEQARAEGLAADVEDVTVPR